MLTVSAKGISMGTVIPFPRERTRPSASGVRIAFVADHWCVERLEAGDIIARNRMPSRSDAERIAARISRRDKIALLAPCLSLRKSSHHRPSGDAA